MLYKCGCGREFNAYVDFVNHRLDCSVSKPANEAINKKMPIIEPIKENPILTEVQALLAKQTEKGLKKYGTTVNVDDYSLIGWIDHILEEKTDEIVYLVTLKHKIKKILK